MKFTSFQPLILTKDAEATVKLFEALGFERNHTNSVISSKGTEIPTYCLKHPDGFHVDVSEVKDMPQDKMLIRMNVDNFDEAYEFLTSKGFTNPSGNKSTDNPTSRSCMMVSPSGFAFDLCQHIKD